MALTFGQLLAGAGRVASGMREEQEAQRVAQLNEMRLQEARRLEADRIRQRNALLAQERQQMQPLEFRPGLDVSQIQRQAQQDRLLGYRTDAAEVARRQAQEAQQQAAQRQAAEQAAQTADVRPRRVPTDPLQAGIRPFREYAQRQTERYREAPQTLGGLTGATVAGTADLLGSAALGTGSYLQSLLATEGPVESALRGQVGRMTEPVIAFGQGMGLGVPDTAVLDAYDRFTGRTRGTEQQEVAQADFLDREYLDRINEGMPPPETQPTAATVVDGVDVEAQETVAQPQYSEELEAPEPEPQTRQAGVSEETNKILGNDSFYLANPNTITREMRTVMNQRQNLARMAEIYRRGRMGEQYAQALASLQELDNNLLFLQGMEGITELTQFRDPRRLSAVMRNVTGANIDYQPRDDGRYNLVRYNPDGSFNVVREGLTPQEISNDARLRVSTNAREQASQLAAERARKELDFEFFQREENVKALNAMAQAMQQGQMDLARELAGNAGGSLQETTEGIAFVVTDPMGQTRVRLYDPGREGKNRWVLPDVDEVPAAFVEVPMANSTGLIQTPDVRLAETLQTWNE